MFARTLLVIVVVLFGLSIGYAEDGIALKFPDDRDCGVISIGPQPTVSNGWTNFVEQRQKSKKLGVARGTVTVPRDAFVELNLNAIAAKDLRFLNDLSADNLHSLTMTHANLGTSELASLARFTSLRSLIIECKIASKIDIETVATPPALEMLNYSVKDSVGRKTMMAWAARCPKLDYLYDRAGPLDVEALRLFRNHPSVSFVTVRFGADAEETIRALSELPKLRALNVDIKTDDYESFLPMLKTVELINWNGGTLGKKNLKAIGQISALKRIRFQGDAKLQSDFGEGLAYVQSLEELSLNCDRSGCSDDALQSGLCSLKKLKDWPVVHNATKRTLDEMSARKNLEGVDVQGLAIETKPEQIAAVIESNPLKSLTLGQFEFTPSVFEAISKCPTLTSLNLHAEGFDGNQLRSPEGLNNLTDLGLNVGYTAVNLAVLSRLPKLQTLNLNTDSVQLLDYGFLADCHSLKSFSTRSNFVNDGAIEQIAKSRSLETMYLGENCVATDQGLKAVIQCQQLKGLQIGGNISVEGVRQLNQIHGLTTLTVSGPFSNEDREKLREQFANVMNSSFYEFGSPYGRLVIGSDGIWRTNDDDGRKKMDLLEGRSLRDMFGAALTEDIDRELQGKVVLVDFWATWCGPCVHFMPELQRMRETFGKDRFEILGIHAQNGVEDMDAFLKANPKPWPNIGDANGQLTESFSVPYFASFYLFDRQGKLRVAQPHRLGLEATIQKLLLE